MQVRGITLSDDATYEGFNAWWQAEQQQIRMQGHSPIRRFKVSARQARSFYNRIGDFLLDEVPVIPGVELCLKLDIAYWAGNGDTNLSDHLWLSHTGPRLTRFRNQKQHWPIDRCRIWEPKDSEYANDLIAKGWEWQVFQQGDQITRTQMQGWFHPTALGHLVNDDYWA